MGESEAKNSGHKKLDITFREASMFSLWATAFIPWACLSWILNFSSSRLIFSWNDTISDYMCKLKFHSTGSCWSNNCLKEIQFSLKDYLLVKTCHGHNIFLEEEKCRNDIGRNTSHEMNLVNLKFYHINALL